MQRELADNKGCIWFHCASLGEFEQGRPLMELMKKEDPSVSILLTFYSPSGYEIRKKYEGADHVYYLPADTPQKARRFLDLVRPRAVFFVKYEFWFNFLDEIGRRNIPAYLVSGMFRKEQLFFKWYGGWFKEKLNCFARFYLQDESSQKLLLENGFTNTVLSGDTRFDRVIDIAREARELPLAEAFRGTKKLIIAGSTWGPDEELLARLDLDKGLYKLLIAPHEIGEEKIAESIARFEKRYRVITYSEANTVNVKDAEVMIVDNIGMLSSLYRYGTIGFIGGGFGEGIHNILEACVCGLPVIFGPNYLKFSEAIDLLALGGAFCVNNSEDLRRTFSLLTGEPPIIQIASEISSNYVRKKCGATERIYIDYALSLQKSR
jgi:3-deoxy-D-manno-octulosonic-acid transferase